MTHQKRLSRGLAGVVGAALVAIALGAGWAEAPEPGMVDIREIGFETMGRSMITFLLAGIAILFAMVGGTMLARQGGRLDRPVPGENRRPLAESDDREEGG